VTRELWLLGTPKVFVSTPKAFANFSPRLSATTTLGLDHKIVIKP
jgi:hypothetical protein